MKENTESAPFLTGEDCNKYIHETFDGLHNDYTHLKEAAINGWQQAANKANTRISELEKRLAESEKRYQDSIERNIDIRERLAEVENEMDKLMNFPKDKAEQINWFLVNILRLLNSDQTSVLVKNLLDRLPKDDKIRIQQQPQEPQ